MVKPGILSWAYTYGFCATQQDIDENKSRYEHEYSHIPLYEIGRLFPDFSCLLQGPFEKIKCGWRIFEVYLDFSTNEVAIHFVRPINNQSSSTP